jgi:Putative zinc-finger
MTCDDCLEHLDDWLDGALDPETAAQVEAHVASCEQDCRRIAEDAKFLRPLVAEWPREVDPPRDLWPEVRAAIAPARRWQAPRALAAAAFLLVALGSGAAGYWLRDVPAARAPSIDVARFESQVDTASAELAAAVEARRDELDPETYETVQRNLAIIDAAIEETRRALERDPDDRRAADALVAAHQQKIRLLRQVLWAPGRNG